MQFELVTPERLLISEPVEMVVVPGTEGNFGVLPGHALLISTIRPGTIEVYEGRTVTRRIFVVGGIAEVTPERCTVLADEAVPRTSSTAPRSRPSCKPIQGNLPSLREQVARAAGTERERLLAELRGLERDQAVARRPSSRRSPKRGADAPRRPALQRHSAVEQDGLAGHVIRRRRRQVERQEADLAQPPRPLERHGLPGAQGTLPHALFA